MDRNGGARHLNGEMSSSTLTMLLALAALFLALMLSLGMRSAEESGAESTTPDRDKRRPVKRAGRGRAKTARASSRPAAPSRKLGRRERDSMLAGMKNRVVDDPRRLGGLVREWVRQEELRGGSHI